MNNDDYPDHDVVTLVMIMIAGTLAIVALFFLIAWLT